MIWTTSGHRPSKIPAYSYERLIKLCQAFIKKYQPSLVNHGAALGFDLAMAEACLLENIPYDSYIPFVGQESKWGENDQKRYNYLVNRSQKIILVSDGEYCPKKFKARNCAMVDNCDKVVCLFSGLRSGTEHCVNYAKSLGRPTINLWDSWIKYGVIS